VRSSSCPSNRNVDDVSKCHCIIIWEGETKDDAKPVDLPNNVNNFSPGAEKYPFFNWIFLLILS